MIEWPFVPENPGQSRSLSKKVVQRVLKNVLFIFICSGLTWAEMVSLLYDLPSVQRDTKTLTTDLSSLGHRVWFKGQCTLAVVALRLQLSLLHIAIVLLRTKSTTCFQMYCNLKYMAIASDHILHSFVPCYFEVTLN